MSVFVPLTALLRFAFWLVVVGVLTGVLLGTHDAANTRTSTDAVTTSTIRIRLGGRRGQRDLTKHACQRRLVCPDRGSWACHVSQPRCGHNHDDAEEADCDRERHFRRRARRLRQRAGVSLAALADRIHYSKGYLSKIENGMAAPNESLAELCDDELGTGGSLAALLAASGTKRRAKRAVSAGARFGLPSVTSISPVVRRRSAQYSPHCATTTRAERWSVFSAVWRASARPRSPCAAPDASRCDSPTDACSWICAGTHPVWHR